MKVIVQFAFFCFFLLAAALVDGIVIVIGAHRANQAPEDSAMMAN